MKTDKFWRLVAQDSGDEPSAFDLLIFNAIGDPWSEETTWAKAFTEELWKLPKSVRRLNIHINSPGGSVAEAQAIYSALADHQSEKVVYIDGIAASAATIPAMVGHRVFIRSNANMMIHSPMAIAFGNANAMRDAISMLESVTESIVNVYQKKSGLDRDELRALMEAETWFTAEQAVKRGFADEVRGVIKAAASTENGHVIFNGTEFDLGAFRYRKTPAFPEATTMNKKATITAQAAPPPEEPPPQEPPPEQKPEPKPAASGAISAEQVEARRKAIAEVRRQFPSEAQDIFNEGILAERTRLAGLDRFSDAACAGIVAAARTDGRTADQIAAECYDAVTRAGRADARRNDAAALNGIKAGDAPFQTMGGKKGTSPTVRAEAVSALIGASKKAHRRN